MQDGIFNGTPNAIAQTGDGYIWIGTQGGLVRFDGVRFVPWIAPNGRQLPSTSVSSLLSARDGSLWIGTAGGLSHWRNQDLTNYLTGQGYISSIVEDRNGTVWITRTQFNDALGPLCQVIETGTRCYGKAAGIPFSDGDPLIEDNSGNLWMGADTGMVRWKPGSASVYNVRGLKFNVQGVTGLVAKRDGSLWVGMAQAGRGLGLQQLAQGVWKPFVAPELDGSTLPVLTLFLDREGALWIGTFQDGIYRIYGHTIDHFRSADGLSSDYVNQFYEDREGNLWAVTTNGIDCFRDMRVASFSKREGLKTDEVDSILASRDGTVWVGAPEALISLRQGCVSSLQSGKGLPGHQVTSLFEDHAGHLWVGIDDSIWIYKDGRFSRIDRPDGRPMGQISWITEDAEKNIWALANKPPRTLVRIHDFKLQEEISAPQIPATRSVAADPRGGIWLGLMNGDLARYRYGKTEIFPFTHRPDSPVYELFVNTNGTVLGATAFGLIGWKEGKQQILTVRNGLPCDGINSFIEGTQGDLWLYTQCGLVQIADAELERWWRQADVRVQLRTFDAFDGVHPGRAPFQAAAKSLDGRLWFASLFALQMIDPGHLTGNALPPPVHVERIVADRRNYLPQDGLRLLPLMRDLEVDYTALSFVAPQKVRFRYRLEGHDAAWQDPGIRRQAFYSDLRPGKYRFRVIACNNDGVWNDAGATLDFSVAPAWYQTSWFRILYISTIVFMVWAVYRLRVRRLARVMSASFDERMAERTRVARELHDTVLQTIQGSKLIAEHALMPLTDPIRMRGALEQLSVWLALAVEEARAALNSLRTTTTQTNDLADALQRVTKDDLIPISMAAEFSVVGDAREMHPIVRDEIYRIGYEAIRNACMHSGATQLQVELRYAHDLTLRVSDNGIGIDPVVGNRGKDGHFGLQGMRERAARIGGRLTFGSSSKSGTEIELVVPGNIVFRKTAPVQQTLFTKIVAIFKGTKHNVD